jgi:hypothetical protein
MFINQDVALQHVKAGKLKALAVSSLARNPLYPRRGRPSSRRASRALEALSWSGLSVPRGTPPGRRREDRRGRRPAVMNSPR